MTYQLWSCRSVWVEHSLYSVQTACTSRLTSACFFIWRLLVMIPKPVFCMTDLESSNMQEKGYSNQLWLFCRFLQMDRMCLSTQSTGLVGRAHMRPDGSKPAVPHTRCAPLLPYKSWVLLYGSKLLFLVFTSLISSLSSVTSCHLPEGSLTASCHSE